MDRKRRGEEIRRRWGPFQDELLNHLNKSISAYQWEQEVRFSKTQQKVDIMGRPLSQGFLVAIELERDRATCARNIIKLWMYLDCEAKNLLLLHVFSPVFVDEKRSWLEEAKFVGEKASKDTGGRLHYQQIVLPVWPADNPEILPQLTTQIMNMLT